MWLVSLLLWTSRSTERTDTRHFRIASRKRSCREPALRRLELVQLRRLDGYAASGVYIDW